MKDTILEVKDLFVTFTQYDRGFSRRMLHAVEKMDLSVRAGEIVAVVGSSGSGKSLLAHAIMGILPYNSAMDGEIRFLGTPLTAERVKKLRGHEIVFVPQSVSYLDPLMKIGAQADGHKKPKPTQQRKRLFERLNLPERTEQLYPFQLSGGMARRVLVSTALITDAQLIIADEPTPGMSLDQALEALKMFREMADEGKAVILITHDIDLAFEFADRVAVFYAGTTVETAPAADFKAGPDALRHPYSKALWIALPQNGFQPIEGFQPYAGHLPQGCLFAPRCPYKTEECEKEVPPVREIRGGEVRCYHGS